MLWTLFVVLLVLWLLGMVSAVTFEGYLHLLLIACIGIILFRIIKPS
jgi:hypothetical protein